MLMSLAQVLSSSYADSLQPKVYNYRQTSGPTNQPRLFHSIHPSTQLQRRKQISRTTETIASLGETGEEKGRGITACWPRRRRWWPAQPPGCSAWRRCLPHLLLKLTPPSGWGAGRSIRASPAARTDGTGTGTGRWESGRGQRRAAPAPEPLDASTRHGDGRSRESGRSKGRGYTAQERNAMWAGKMGQQKNTVRAEFFFFFF